MDISVFQVLGPIMIGPSSSHTAGAAKLARIAATIAGNGFYKVEFGLHGSFAKTGLGHGTDKALVAGILNMKEDDEQIKNSFLHLHICKHFLCLYLNITTYFLCCQYFLVTF